METLERNEWADVAQLVEITSDAVIICELDGTILHVNNRLLDLMCEDCADVIGGDVKDVLYSSAFERATEHRLPFETDGSESELMLKLSDGSFIPVLVRAGSVTPPRIFGRRAPRVLVALHSIEEQYSHDRQLKRALSELRVANKRLSGTLSVIMSTVGSDELPSLLDTVLNQLVGTLDASGAAIYFSESGGFKLRGVSKELEDSYLPEFMPYARAFRPTCFASRVPVACRFSRTLRATGLLRVCSWIWTIVPSTCCACRICPRIAARSVFPCFTARSPWRVGSWLETPPGATCL